MMKDKFWVRLVKLAGIYGLFVCLMYWIVQDDWKQTAIWTDQVNVDGVLSEVNEESTIEQHFTSQVDRLDQLEITIQHTQRRRENGFLEFRLWAGEKLLGTWTIDDGAVPEDNVIRLPLDEAPEHMRGTELKICISGRSDAAICYGYSRSAGKIQVEDQDAGGLWVNGQPQRGELVMRQMGVRLMNYMDYYWPAAAAGAILLGAAYWAFCRGKASGRMSRLNKAVNLYRQYEYLLKTLVLRDFRVKYKASMLGVIWSFLNPLMMTMVYHFVFSTIFRSSSNHFVVYLMSGIVLFNYFSDSTNLCMQSVVGNAGLITKVYMPKYILPVSKALSSAINMVISLIPLLIVMLLSGTGFHKSLLLIPFVLVMLILFCTGVGLILSTIMVYFRDIQFLWSVLLTILNFLSPIFYPESIIPARFQMIYHMNPLYQYLYFMRTVTIGGTSPTPVTFLYCMLSSAAALTVGLLVFRKNQSQFVLHL